MTQVRVKGFKIFNDRHGRQRCYHRATGKPIDLKKYSFGSLEFFGECKRITDLLGKGDQTKPGTLGALIAKYRASPAFQDLAPRTTKDYQRIFDYLKDIDGTLLIKFTPPLIARIRDKAGASKGRRFGNYVKTVFSLLFAWGKERGFVKENPAADINSIRKPKGAPEANRPWLDHEREAVMAALPPHMALPVALMMYLGIDPQDAVKLPADAVKDGRIDTRRGKTGRPVYLPIIKPLADAIAKNPAHTAKTLCANSRGESWTPDGFRASWRPIKLKLEKEGKVQSGLTLKGLRHTVATILREMGYDPATIADVLGQKTEAMARHYSRRADMSSSNESVMKKFSAELSSRDRKLSNLSRKSVKLEKSSAPKETNK